MPPSTWFVANGDGIAERFLACRESFRSRNKPVHVKVGFHYTWSGSVSCDTNIVEKIRREGLLSTRENSDGKPKIAARIGNTFGTGIYLSENPHAFSALGDIGILVLYIAGTTEQLSRAGGNDSTADSFRGNKLTKSFRWNKLTETNIEYEFPKSSYFDEIIVNRSDQILPVYAYPRSAINNAYMMHQLHVKVQELVDRTINFVEDYTDGSAECCDPRKTAVPRIFPTYRDIQIEHKYYASNRQHFREHLRYRFLSNGIVIPN